MAYYRAYGSRDPREAGLRLKHLDRHFHGQKLLDIDSAAITAYVVRRKAQGAANGTINIELATLRKALKVAQKHGKLGKVPAIKMLKPAAPREGFFERAQFEAVCRALPDALRVVVRIGYLYGWRLKSEVLTLTRR
jgi:site-specific recombinase XerD